MCLCVCVTARRALPGGFPPLIQWTENQWLGWAAGELGPTGKFLCGTQPWKSLDKRDPSPPWDPGRWILTIPWQEQVSQGRLSSFLYTDSFPLVSPTTNSFNFKQREKRVLGWVTAEPSKLWWAQPGKITRPQCIFSKCIKNLLQLTQL